MQIKPVPFSPDSTGLPAEGYAYYIGFPNENPELEANQVVVRDGRNGPETSNPFFVNANGNFQNANGQPINPWIDASSYSVAVNDTFGARYRYIAEYTSDNIITTNDGSLAFIVNNLNDLVTGARFQDLSLYNTVLIESLNSGWEGTVDGPVGGFYAHKDGTLGEATTGNQDKFFDASGTGFSRDKAQRVASDGLTTVIDSATNQISVPGAVPVGSGMDWWTDTIPDGWIEIFNGLELNRLEQPLLFQVWGDLYGGDGSTTFGVPPVSGRAVRYIDNGAGVDPDAATRTAAVNGLAGDNVGTTQEDENCRA